MGKRQEIQITTEQARIQGDIMAKLSHHIKEKGLKYLVMNFGCAKECVNTIFE